MAQTPKRWFIWTLTPSERHLGVCPIYSETTVAFFGVGLSPPPILPSECPGSTRARHDLPGYASCGKTRPGPRETKKHANKEVVQVRCYAGEGSQKHAVVGGGKTGKIH